MNEVHPLGSMNINRLNGNSAISYLVHIHETKGKVIYQTKMDRDSLENINVCSIFHYNLPA